MGTKGFQKGHIVSEETRAKISKAKDGNFYATCDYLCSACGRSYHTKVPYFSEFHFCPSCGAKMENKKRLGIKPP